MRYGECIRSIAIFLLLAGAGALAPANSAKAMIVSWVTCQNVYGTVTDPDGSYVYTDIVCYETSYDDGYYNDPVYDEGGGGGGPSAPQQPTVCDALRAIKPANCSNPMTTPRGYDYGKDGYQATSGLAVILGALDSHLLLPTPTMTIKGALTLQTTHIASLTMPLSEVNSKLLSSMKSACQMQARMALPGALGTQRCAEALARMEQEAGIPGFWDWFGDWLETNHIDLGLAIASLQSLVDMLAPDNSLTAKYNIVTHDQQCHDWWENVEDNNCAI